MLQEHQIKYLKQQTWMAHQLASVVIASLLFTVCIISLQFCRLNTQTDEATCLLQKVSHAAGELLIIQIGTYKKELV